MHYEPSLFSQDGAKRSCGLYKSKMNNTNIHNLDWTLLVTRDFLYGKQITQSSAIDVLGFLIRELQKYSKWF